MADVESARRAITELDWHEYERHRTVDKRSRRHRAAVAGLAAATAANRAGNTTAFFR